MLPGLVVKEIRRFSDERGSFGEIIRSDWSDILGEDSGIAQANLSFSHPGVVRAWHRHGRGQVDCFVVVGGSIKICAFDDKSEELNEIVATRESLRVVKVPGEYWHGFKVVGSEEATLVYFVNKLYDYASPDEERRPWDDQSIVPLSINGSRTDSRCGKPWNWFYPPHK